MPRVCGSRGETGLRYAGRSNAPCCAVAIIKPRTRVSSNRNDRVDDAISDECIRARILSAGCVRDRSVNIRIRVPPSYYSVALQQSVVVSTSVQGGPKLRPIRLDDLRPRRRIDPWDGSESARSQAISDSAYNCLGQ